MSLYKENSSLSSVMLFAMIILLVNVTIIIIEKQDFSRTDVQMSSIHISHFSTSIYLKKITKLKHGVEIRFINCGLCERGKKEDDRWPSYPH